MTKNKEDFRKFLSDHVNVNDSRMKRLRRAVRAVDDYLSDNLKGYQNMERQGSFALGTIIKPVKKNGEFDADIQIVMNPNDDWEPKDYINAIYNALDENANYSDKLRRKTRCVTIDYAGDFHLDVVPRVTIQGQHYVCNRLENEFEPTDGNGYRDWFNEKNRITDGNLKRAVRMLKYLRDHKGNFTAKSILLTTLAGNTIESWDEGTEAVSTVADTLCTILTRMDAYLQMNPWMPEIRNPVLPTETFNRHWDQLRYENFRKRINAHAQTAREALDAESSEDAIKGWRKLFGEDFGKGSSGGGNGTGGSSKPKPSGSPGGARPVVVAPPPVKPRRQYAGALATARPKTQAVRISGRDLEWLRGVQPELSYDAENNLIIGRLTFAERYDKDDDLLKPLAPPGEECSRMAVRDSFDVEIRLCFEPAPFNPWPPVVETGGRIQRIMEEQGIANIADMHCYPGFPENRCCLGFEVDTGEKFRLSEFIRELVVPFFYRVAYVERYGLEASRRDLWPTYSHNLEETEREYLGELRGMAKAGRNETCPCGSGRKYKRCHLPEVSAARRHRLL